MNEATPNTSFLPESIPPHKPIIVKGIQLTFTEDTDPAVVEGAPRLEVMRIIEELELPPFDRCIFLMGGANKMPDETEVEEDLITFLVKQAQETNGKLLVGDGGTNSGIMKIAGKARLAAEKLGFSFTLVGVAPEAEIQSPENPQGVQLDPNHTHIITIQSSEKDGSWGSETAMMYKLFNTLAEDKDQFGINVNGGGITLDEIRQNLLVNRRIIIRNNSGRLADAISAYHTLQKLISSGDVITPVNTPFRLLNEDSRKLLTKYLFMINELKEKHGMTDNEINQLIEVRSKLNK